MRVVRCGWSRDERRDGELSVRGSRDLPRVCVRVQVRVRTAKKTSKKAPRERHLRSLP
jgi:hypothetical protein